MLIGFDDMVADMLNPVVTELFIIGKKLNISLDFIAQYYFVAQKKSEANFYALFYHAHYI